MNDSQELFVYIKSDLHPEGEFIPDSEAKISVWDLGYTMGYNVYDWARTFNGKPWQLKEHIARLYRGCKTCKLNPEMSPQELERICIEVSSRNEPLLNVDEGQEYSIIIEVTAGEYGWIDFGHGRDYPIPEKKGKPTVIVKNKLIDMKSLGMFYKSGSPIVTPSTRNENPIVRDPKVKTYSRLGSVNAVCEASLVDPEAIPILLDVNGNLTEVHVGNIFLVYDGKLMTPTTRDILEGTSRSNIIRLANENNIPFCETDLQPFHLYNAEEAFLTNAVWCIRPVNQFNGVQIGKELPGPITNQLTEAWKKWINYDITGLSFIKE